MERATWRKKSAPVTYRTFEVNYGAEGYLVQRPGWRLGVYATIEEAKEAVDRVMTAENRERLKLNLQSLFIVGAVCFSFVAVMTWPGGWKIASLLWALVGIMMTAGG
jgi:hypothetical protein